VSFDDGIVRFRWRDRRRGNRSRTMALTQNEFLHRFLLHVLPRGFMRIRHFGLFANRTRAAKLALARTALRQIPPEPPSAETPADFMMRISGIDILRCPRCRQGRLQIVAVTLPWRVSLSATGPPL
jgi:hypothetical protein